MNKIKKATDFQKYLQEQLKNKKIKKYYDEYDKQMEIAYQIIKLRKNKKMSQLALAKKIGTTQGNIARMESGQQNFTIEILDKVAKAFDRNLKVLI
jgi:DNA-binding XRE family transcriptional regulator